MSDFTARNPKLPVLEAPDTGEQLLTGTIAGIE